MELKEYITSIENLEKFPTDQDIKVALDNNIVILNYKEGWEYKYDNDNLSFGGSDYCYTLQGAVNSLMYFPSKNEDDFIEWNLYAEDYEIYKWSNLLKSHSAFRAFNNKGFLYFDNYGFFFPYNDFVNNYAWNLYVKKYKKLLNIFDTSNYLSNFDYEKVGNEDFPIVFKKGKFDNLTLFPFRAKFIPNTNVDIIYKELKKIEIHDAKYYFKEEKILCKDGNFILIRDSNLYALFSHDDEILIPFADRFIEELGIGKYKKDLSYYNISDILFVKVTVINENNKILLRDRSYYSYVDEVEHDFYMVSLDNPNASYPDLQIGFLDKNFKEIIPLFTPFIDLPNAGTYYKHYESLVCFSEELLAINKYDESVKYFDKLGRIYLDLIYDYGRNFKCGLAAVYLKQLRYKTSSINNSRVEIYGWGFIDKKGNQIIDCCSLMVTDFSEDIAGIYTESSKWTFIDKNGNYICKSYTEFADIKQCSDGVIGVMNEKGKWGFINKEGVLFIDYIYQEVLEFTDGSCKVRLENDFFLINKLGEII